MSDISRVSVLFCAGLNSAHSVADGARGELGLGTHLADCAMAEELALPETADRAELYAALLPQLRALVADEPNLVANLANTAAVLHVALGSLWTGFYLVEDDTSLVLGPFQGPIACTRIPLAPSPQGVCGAAWQRRQAVVVPDVDAFPGHIACSSLSRSEIVVPIVVDARVVAVLDIDSAELSAFDLVDVEGLESVLELLAHHWRDVS